MAAVGHHRNRHLLKIETDIGYKVANVLEGKLLCAGAYMLVYRCVVRWLTARRAGIQIPHVCLDVFSFMALISLALQESVCSMSLVPGNYVVVFCSREPAKSWDM